MTYTMKRGTLLLCTAAALIFAGCKEERIVAPELTPNEPAIVAGQDAALSKAVSKRHFAALLVVTGGSAPQMTWTGNVLHNRGAVRTGVITGDIVATFTFHMNGVLVQKGDILAGPTRGTGTWTISELFGKPVDGVLQVGLHGRTEISSSGRFLSGRLNGHGTGNLKGMKMHGTFGNPSGVPGSYELSGYILDPKGRI